METVRTIEIPVITQVKRRVQEGHLAEAATLAYQTAVVDLQRAYQFRFPPHWTHLDVLQWARRHNLGIVADCIAKLYRLYEPVRYGRASDLVEGDVISPLTSLYAQSALWRLYAVGSWRGPGGGAGSAYGSALGYPSGGGGGEERALPGA